MALTTINSDTSMIPCTPASPSAAVSEQLRAAPTGAWWKRGCGRYSLWDVTATMDITADWLTSSTIAA